MSLILDALQQAEHERNGARSAAVLSPAPAAPSVAGTAAPLRRWPWWLAAGLMAGTAALGWWVGSRPRPALAPVQTAPQSQAPTPAIATAPGTALFAPPVPEQVLPPITSAAPPTAAAPPPAAPVLRPSPEAATAGSAPPAPAAAPTSNELPEDVRSGLPTLTITGHTYSDNPTLRTLMIDGRMFVEGQALAPGLRLERIGPHAAVFNQRGTRFSVVY